MKKLLVALALLTVSTLSFADDDEVKVVPGNSSEKGSDVGVWIIDGKKVFKCYTGVYNGCILVSSDYTKAK